MRRMAIALALASMLLSPVPLARAQGSGGNSQIDIRDFPTWSCVWERPPMSVFFKANGDLLGLHIVDMIMRHWNRVRRTILIEECDHPSDSSAEAVMERTRSLTALLVARGVHESQIWTRRISPGHCNDPGTPPTARVNVEGRQLACAIDVWNSQQEWWERNCLAAVADPRSTLCQATWEIIRGRWPSNVPAVTP